MTSITTYLTFNGNCREAMIFYKECLGGELTFQTVGNAPRSSKMPKKMRDVILHASLKNDKLILMASDMVGENGLILGNSIALLLHCSSKKETKELYKRLSQGGKKTQPLGDNFQGALIGDLTDRYGNHWLLHYQNNVSRKDAA